MPAQADSRQAAQLERLRVRPGPPVSAADLPRVAVVTLNYNGRPHLERCFSSLAGLDYPEERRQVWLVDNGSSDGSAAWVRRQHPWVSLVANPENRGFAPACNQGASRARKEAEPADVLVFLNNDMRVEPTWLRELVAPLVRGECDATTAKMLSWNGKKVNFAGGGMNFHGIGIQKGYGLPPGPEHDVPARSLFPCGGAMAVRAEVFESAGGFDEAFFAYYEDVDLGWRLWVLGHEVHYVPSAVCYHHHSSTSAAFPMEAVRLLQVRNPLLACFKNYDDDNLRHVFGPAMALSFRRMLNIAGVTSHWDFRIENARPRRTGRLGRWTEKLRGGVRSQLPVHRGAVADLLGINDLLGDWEHWRGRRAEVQDRRRRPDAEILPLFHQPLWCIDRNDGGYKDLHKGLVEMFGLDELFAGLSADAPEPLH